MIFAKTTITAHRLRILVLITLVMVSFGFYSFGQGDQFEHYKIDLNAKRIDFFEAIEHVEIIRLEETKNTLLSRIQWYLKTPDGFALPSYSDEPVIHLFNEMGNYKTTINRFGQGPEEYTGFGDIWIKDGRIELFSGTSRILQRYTLEGEYLETLKAGFGEELWGGSMKPYGQGYVLQPLDRYLKKRENYSLVFLDSELKIRKRVFPVKDPMKFPVNLGKRFRELEGTVFYKRILKDSVYSLEEDQVVPRFKFDFGEDWAWNDPRSNSTMKNASNIVGQDGKIFEVLPDIGERYIILTYHYKIMKRGKGRIDRMSGKFNRFDMRKKNGEDFDVYFIQWENDRLVSSLQAYDFEEFVTRLDEDQFTINGGVSIDEILSSENPTLMRIKFKD